MVLRLGRREGDEICLGHLVQHKLHSTVTRSEATFPRSVSDNALQRCLVPKALLRRRARKLFLIYLRKEVLVHVLFMSLRECTILHMLSDGKNTSNERKVYIRH